MRPKPWWWWPYQLWKYLFFLPLACLYTLLGSAVILVLIPFVNPSTLSQVIAGSWARFCAFLVPMPVRVVGRERIDPGRSYVVTSNHQSLFDILVLYGWLDLDIRWVMKQELRSIPGLGAACAALGHIYIDRSDHESAVASINAAREQIRNGTSVLFFPEGTRSDDGRLKRFKKGAFRFAIDAGLPILPVTVDGTCEVLPARRWDLRPGTATLMIHDPIETDGLAAEDLPRLAHRVQTVIGGALAEGCEADA